MNNNSLSKEGGRGLGLGWPHGSSLPSDVPPALTRRGQDSHCLLSAAPHPPRPEASCGLPPAGPRRDHLGWAFDTPHSIAKTRKRGQEPAAAVTSLTRACVSIYCGLVPLTSQSLTTL